MQLFIPLSVGHGYYTGSQSEGVVLSVFFLKKSQNRFLPSFSPPAPSCLQKLSVLGFMPSLRENPDPPAFQVF